MNYYNEHDPKAASWLRELIAAGLIAPGEVDERSITEIRPYELTGYTQQHFFAGIGGWSYALRLAGWPDNRPVRTGSCPCQPFSNCGKGLGTADERHLWPVFRDLISFGEPTVTFGEQVASKAGREWLAGIRADLEGLGYAVGAADLCAAGVGSPHIRQRLYWVADPDGWDAGAKWKQRGREHGQLAENRMAGRLGFAEGDDGRRYAGGLSCATAEDEIAPRANHGRAAGSAGAWSDYDLISCIDGKTRRIEPGSSPLANGISGRMGLLRGYGNAIVPEIAAEFVMAWKETNPGNETSSNQGRS